MHRGGHALWPRQPQRHLGDAPATYAGAAGRLGREAISHPTLRSSDDAEPSKQWGPRGGAGLGHNHGVVLDGAFYDEGYPMGDPSFNEGMQEGGRFVEDEGVSYELHL